MTVSNIQVVNLSDVTFLMSTFIWLWRFTLCVTLCAKNISLHKKRSFPLRISSVNVTKSAVSWNEMFKIHWGLSAEILRETFLSKTIRIIFSETIFLKKCTLCHHDTESLSFLVPKIWIQYQCNWSNQRALTPSNEK